MSGGRSIVTLITLVTLLAVAVLGDLLGCATTPASQSAAPPTQLRPAVAYDAEGNLLPLSLPSFAAFVDSVPEYRAAFSQPFMHPSTRQTIHEDYDNFCYRRQIAWQTAYLAESQRQDRELVDALREIQEGERELDLLREMGRDEPRLQGGLIRNPLYEEPTAVESVDAPAPADPPVNAEGQP